MNKTVCNKMLSPFSLHDMTVVSLEIEGNNIIVRTQSGMVETTAPYRQLDGWVELHDVQWDFCYVYLLGFTGNVGIFTGEKMFLKDFIDKYKQFGFSVMDETYGYNMTKYCGYLIANRQHCECIMEIYHEGDLVFVTNE